MPSKQRKKTTAEQPAVKRPAGVRPSAGQLSLKDYLLLNVVFSGFCLLQLILVRIMLRDFAGLYFFFIFLMVSFLIVSLFDYLSNRVGMGDQIEGNNITVDEHF